MPSNKTDVFKAHLLVTLECNPFLAYSCPFMTLETAGDLNSKTQPILTCKCVIRTQPQQKISKDVLATELPLTRQNPGVFQAMVKVLPQQARIRLKVLCSKSEPCHLAERLPAGSSARALRNRKELFNIPPTSKWLSPNNEAVCVH